MTTFRQKRCSNCSVRYSYQASGYGGLQKDNDDRYCPDCLCVVRDALERVPKRSQRAWVGCSDATVESLVAQENSASKPEGWLPIRRVLPGEIDMARPSNKHMQGFVLRDGRTYRYEYWTEQGGMAAGRVYIEVEKDADDHILGPWNFKDRWETQPTFIEHPPWPEQPPATHEFVRKPMSLPKTRI